MRIKVILIPLLFALVATSAVDSRAGEEIYRWVDEDGVVHFGNNAEGHPDAELVTVRGTAGISPSQPAAADAAKSVETTETLASRAEQQREERAQSREEAAERQQQVSATCKVARERVAALEPSPRVIIENEDGTVSRMDDEERLALLNEAQAYITENCDE